MTPVMTPERRAEIAQRLERDKSFCPGGWIAQTMSDCAALLSELTRRDEAEAALRALAEKLAGALGYMVKVREIKCEHKHAGPDPFCAKCLCDDALTDWNAYKAGQTKQDASALHDTRNPNVLYRQRAGQKEGERK